MTGIVSVDELCAALEATLREHLVPTMTALGFDYGDVKTWQQVPTLSALATADLPAIAVTSPGLIGDPTYSRSSRKWTATWRISAGIYVRGEGHLETQKKVRDWTAGIRTAVLRHRTLGGVANSLTWSGEQYADRPERESARTLGGGSATFAVTADLPEPTIGALPVVTSTPTTLSVQ
jgi:hypothetical protein